MPEATYFASPEAFRRWLARHHRARTELWVGFYKRSTGRPSMTWPESVDEALCFGWIDGVRTRVDERRYTIRFTPRRPKSIWSAINIRRAHVLRSTGRMRAAGLTAFAARVENRSGVYSYEQRSDRLEEPYASLLKRHRPAWTFFAAQPPSYRKMVGWWIVSAKKEETRVTRLQTLIERSAQGVRL
jgi:uncharacterized protein YdeI (YjbR/CyaY-like superfamily)